MKESKLSDFLSHIKEYILPAHKLGGKELDNFLPRIEDYILPRQGKTLYDIITRRASHKEKYSSNTLLFFLNANEEHKLGDLFLQALLTLLPRHEGDNKAINSRFVSIDAEVTTESGKRYDLLLQTQHQAIVIENKILSTLDNELDIYYQDLTKICPNKECLIVVLALKHYPYQWHFGESHFASLTHHEYLEKVQEMMKRSVNVSASPPQYALLLKEYIKNMDNPVAWSENIEARDGLDQAILARNDRTAEKLTAALESHGHSAFDVEGQKTKVVNLRGRSFPHTQLFCGFTEQQLRLNFYLLFCLDVKHSRYILTLKFHRAPETDKEKDHVGKFLQAHLTQRCGGNITDEYFVGPPFFTEITRPISTYDTAIDEDIKNVMSQIDHLPNVLQMRMLMEQNP